MAHLILASGSPRRRDLLAQIGVEVTVAPMDVDESVLPREAPDDYVRRVALRKAQAAAAVYPESDLPILAADTTVVCDGDILGKPNDQKQALSMLSQLSGRMHEVKTAVALVRGSECQQTLVTTRVFFHPIPVAQREMYWRLGEPVDKAGAYGIQGFGAMFVERIEGCYFNVVGLPLSAVVGLLAEFGISPLRQALLQHQ